MAANFARFAELGRKIVCIGRNYRDHAVELGNPISEVPLLFLKPASSYIVDQWTGLKLECSSSLHHEIELGLVICQRGTNITESHAMNHVAGYVLALDMTATARDLQTIAKKQGLPWDMAKGFDTSCPVSSFIPNASIPDPQNVDLWCKVNGKLRQNGNTKDMIFSIPHLVSYISEYLTLEPYDVILTGTPAGVGPVVPEIRKHLTKALADVVERYGLVKFTPLSLSDKESLILALKLIDCAIGYSASGEDNLIASFIQEDKDIKDLTAMLNEKYVFPKKAEIPINLVGSIKERNEDGTLTD